MDPLLTANITLLVAFVVDLAIKIAAGGQLNGTDYKVHLDGHNQLDYITGATDVSPRQHFFYVSDEGDLTALPGCSTASSSSSRRRRTSREWHRPSSSSRNGKLLPLSRSIRCSRSSKQRRPATPNHSNERGTRDESRVPRSCGGGYSPAEASALSLCGADASAAASVSISDAACSNCD